MPSSLARIFVDLIPAQCKISAGFGDQKMRADLFHFGVHVYVGEEFAASAAWTAEGAITAEDLASMAAAGLLHQWMDGG